MTVPSGVKEPGSGGDDTGACTRIKSRIGRMRSEDLDNARACKSGIGHFRKWVYGVCGVDREVSGRRRRVRATTSKSWM